MLVGLLRRACSVTAPAFQQGRAHPPLCCRWPGRKDESWWLLVGNAETNALLTIKKVSMTKAVVKAPLKFEAPAQPGTHKLTLYFMCDSYMGCDQVGLPSRLCCSVLASQAFLSCPGLAGQQAPQRRHGLCVAP